MRILRDVLHRWKSRLAATPTARATGSNVKLSEDRVNEVKKYLVSKGIDPSASHEGYGGTEPIANNERKKPAASTAGWSLRLRRSRVSSAGLVVGEGAKKAASPCL
ncbi:MAG: OmpA family protein [Hymenobacter sp.]